MDISLQIEAVYQRISLLRQHATDVPLQPDLLEKAIKDLHLVLEELQTSQEELRHQNQALIATQQEVELERQRYQTLFDMAPDGYVVTDLQGKIHKANHVAAQLLSTPQEYLVNKPLSALIHEHDLTLFRTRLVKLEHGQSWEVSLNLRTGELRNLEIAVVRIKNTHKKADELLWSLHDISLSKKIKQELQTAHDGLEQEVDNRTIQLSQTNVKLQLEITQRHHSEESRLQRIERERLVTLIAQRIRKSLSIDEILRTTVEEVRQFLQVDRTLIYRLSKDGVGTVITEAVLPDYPAILGQSFPEEVFPQKFHQAYAQGKIRAVANVEQEEMEPCVREFVRQFDVQAKLIMPILQGEDLWGLLIVHQCHQPQPWESVDIELLKQLTTQVEIAIQQSELYQQAQNELSERKLAEQKIQEQVALLDIATDAISVRDLENRILFWNKGAERLYGCLAEDAVGKNATDLFDSGNLDQPDTIMPIVIQLGAWQGELQKKTKDGRELLVESRWTLVRDEIGQPKSFLVVDTDITEKKQLEQQAFRTQRLESLGTLASGIAHDFNNILTPILAGIQMLPVKLPDLDERTLQFLKMIEGSARRGAGLVQQILSFAQGIEGKTSVLHVESILLEILKIIQETFPKSIQVTHNISSKNIWSISADATQLHQVLMNLVINARDAMPNGGTLSISIENQLLDESFVKTNMEAKIGPHIVISVTDTGIGIEPEILDRIFDPFFTTKSVGKGTGLGLSTLLGIIKNHKGFIKLNSQLGQGSEFKIFLPAIEEMVAKSAEVLSSPVGNGELILIVDDEISIQTVNQSLLESYNFRTLTASNGLEAITLLKAHQHEISLVLMDIMMPSMDGMTAIRIFKEINPNVKVIVMSGLISHSQFNDPTGIGIEALLAKPYSTQELLTTINSTLNNKLYTNTTEIS